MDRSKDRQKYWQCRGRPSLADPFGSILNHAS